jgi:predicted TIM-barrel fold metal-dependent hydrolase
MSTVSDHRQADLRIIDCDAHLTEPPDLWTSRAPTNAKDRVPVQRTIDGRTAWYHDNRPWASTGGNIIRRGRGKILGAHIIQPFDEIDPAAWSVPHRLALLDEMGVEAQILYPNGIGFASNHIFAIDDERERTLILQIYNDFLVDVQEESGGRLLPQALLPIWDMDLTVAEMSRLLDRGIRGFTLSDRPELLGLPELGEPYFEPMWDVFDTSAAVANFHIGAGARREDIEAMRARSSLSPEELTRSKPAASDLSIAPLAWTCIGNQRGRATTASQMFMSNARIIANLCMSDLFDRFPRLRIASAESGIGWIPFMLQSLDYQFDEMVTDPSEVGFAQRRPSEYFRDHIFVMFWFEDVTPDAVNRIGPSQVLVETDVPHPTCLYPDTKDRFAAVLLDADPEIRRRVLRDNAVGLYRVAVSETP